MRNQLLQFFFIPFLLLACTACHKDHVPPPVSSTARISMEMDPNTLDPRQARDLSPATAIHMLYEGLTRLNRKGQPVPAIAESIAISDDLKTYTFGIRKSGWSDGKAVTAYDFEKTWKSILDPQFPAPNAYQLYVIKGAKAAKEGKISLDDVGIKALDDQTLVVELEKPTPYFLNLTATYFYYPVGWELRDKAFSTEKMTPDNLVTNGPFKLQSWTRHNEMTLITNPYYWDSPSVQLDKVTFIVADNPTALAMFDRKELDWMGSPLCTIPTDAIVALKGQNRLQIAPAAGTYLLRLNVDRPPLNHPKMRQALGLALNRQDLVEHVLQGNQIPATSYVPSTFLPHAPLYQDYDIERARQLFQEALAEMHLQKESLPPITLCYAANERNHKIAQVAQQQWKEALGLDVQLQSCESKVAFDRLKHQDYQIAIGSWFADFKDPISFLEVFKFKNNGTNNTQWEHPLYVQLLEQSEQEGNPQKREALLTEAEKILIAEMPIIPLFYASYNYLKCPHLKNVYFSELGYLDLKHASIEE